MSVSPVITTQPIGPFRLIGKAVSTIFGTTLAVPAGLATGVVDGAAARGTGRISPELVSKLTLKEGEHVASTVMKSTRGFSANFIAEGLHNIGKSGVGTAISEVYAGGGAAGIGESISKTFGALGNCGGKGLALLGLHVFGAGLSIWSGVTHAIESFNKFSDACKGWRTDVVKNPYVHLFDAAAGVTTAVGGVLMLFPPTAMQGLSISAVGFLATMGCSLFKWAGWGNHWFNLPEKAPIGLSNIIKSVHNPELIETI